MKKRNQWLAILLMMALICCASCAQKDAAGEQAVVGEQVESSAEEKNPIAQTPSNPTEEQPTEKPKDQPQKSVEENDGQIEEPKKQESEQPFDSMVKRVEINDYPELVRITKGDLEGLFDYDIYYYGISAFMVELDGKIVNFRTAIEQDPTVLDRLFKQWNEQTEPVYAYDGGSALYDFKEYRIYKLNAMEWNDVNRKNETRKDLIIASPDITLDEAKEATK